MGSELRDFLEKCRVKRGEPFTHTSKSAKGAEQWIKGSYAIYSSPDNHLKEFRTLYCSTVISGIYPTITEKPQSFFPYRLDFDLKADAEKVTTRSYTREDIELIVGICQEEIKKVVDVNVFEDRMLYALVLEKEKPRLEDGILKDGFHIHFPHFICDAWLQDNYLYNKVLNRLLDKGLWNAHVLSSKESKYTAKYLNPLNKIMDNGIGNVPWMMYGSMNYKNKKSTPYLYNRYGGKTEWGYAFDENVNMISLDKMFDREMIGKRNNVTYHLPTLLSIRDHKTPTELKEEITALMKSNINERGPKKIRKRIVRPTKSKESIIAELTMIKDGEIMEMLSEDRADDWQQWLLVGYTLFNIGQGCEEALSMWIEFSKRSDKFQNGVCEDEWSKMYLSTKSIGSLLEMARQDSPAKYKIWKDLNVSNLMWESVKSPKINEYDISKVLHKMYADRFVCADAKRDMWFEFRDHRWHEMDDGIPLRKIIPEDLYRRYVAFSVEIGDKRGRINADNNLAADDRENQVERYGKYQDNCNKIIMKLKEKASMDRIVSHCKMHFHSPNFLKLRDENMNLLGCNNGVIDLELCIFRPGIPDDFITMNTDIDFEMMNDKDEDMRELDDMLEKIFPDPEKREYFLDFCCMLMFGENKNKLFLIATGGGDNGKSVMFAILERMLGSGINGYFGKFPRETMIKTRGVSGSSARPELARVRGKRAMGSQEIAKTEELNIGFIKEMTSNLDSFFARSIYEKGTEIKPRFTLAMQCNELPKIPGHDEATWNRIRILQFESTFIKPNDLKGRKVPASIHEQRLKKIFTADPTIADRITEIARALLCKCFKRLPSFKERVENRQVREPECVLVATEEYRMRNDVHLQFFAQNIEKVPEAELRNGDEIRRDIYIRHSELASRFNTWYSKEYPAYNKDKDILISGNIKHEMSKKMSVIKNLDHGDLYGLYDNGRRTVWYGYRFIEEEDNTGVQEEIHKMLSKNRDVLVMEEEE